MNSGTHDSGIGCYLDAEDDMCIKIFENLAGDVETFLSIVPPKARAWPHSNQPPRVQLSILSATKSTLKIFDG